MASLTPRDWAQAGLAGWLPQVSDNPTFWPVSKNIDLQYVPRRSNPELKIALDYSLSGSRVIQVGSGNFAGFSKR
ncbi:MAG: hypothetical protein WAM39_26215 [Bryobacteraceae bacterium]